MDKSRTKRRTLTRQYNRRKHRTNTRAVVAGHPRIVVTRSNKYIYAQLIDTNGSVICAADDRALTTGTKKERAYSVGEDLAKKAASADLSTVSFDRNGYVYHGRVASLAEGARAGGLAF